MNKYLEKIAQSEVYTHATSDSGLERILESGRIKHVAHLAKENPDLQVTVEPLPLPFVRQTMRAEDALKAMNGVKVTDKIFLTKGGYLPSYGDNVIVKNLSSAKKRASFNTIPEEHIIGRALSVRSNASIYVPDERLDEWKSKYHDVSFKPKSQLQLKAYTVADRLAAYPSKLVDALGLNKSASHPISPHSIGSTAFIGGSTGLGINVDNSDVDIFAPYARRANYLKALERVKARHPELKERASALKNEHKTTLTGVVNGQDIIGIS